MAREKDVGEKNDRASASTTAKESAMPEDGFASREVENEERMCGWEGREEEEEEVSASDVEVMSRAVDPTLHFKTQPQPFCGRLRQAQSQRQEAATQERRRVRYSIYLLY